MHTLRQLVEALNELIINDETVKAMELYYAPDVEMQENEESPRKGKDFCIEREKQLLELFDLKCKLIHQAIDDETDVVLTEWELTITNKETKVVSKRKQVAVQLWEEGLVQREKFYYNRYPQKA